MIGCQRFVWKLHSLNLNRTNSEYRLCISPRTFFLKPHKQNDFSHVPPANGIVCDDFFFLIGYEFLFVFIFVMYGQIRRNILTKSQNQLNFLQKLKLMWSYFIFISIYFIQSTNRHVLFECVRITTGIYWNETLKTRAKKSVRYQFSLQG